MGEENLGSIEFRGRLQRAYGDESMKVMHSIQLMTVIDNDWELIDDQIQSCEEIEHFSYVRNDL